MMVRLEEHPRIAVVGLGNALLTDDGVGVHAVRRLRERLPEGVIVAEIGTAVLGALDLFETVHSVIAIDAVKAGGPPGSIYCLNVDEARVGKSISLHDHGISAALQHLAVESRPEVTILGVEPEVVAYGMELSPTIKAVLPRVLEIASSMAEHAVKHEKGSVCPEAPGVDLGSLQKWEFEYEDI